MLFNSYSFILLFLPISVVGYWLMRGGRAKRLWLLGANLVFYLNAGIAPLLLLLALLLLTYLSTRYLMSSERWRNYGLTITLIPLLVLVAVKYVGLLVQGQAGADFAVSTLSVSTVLGISFYTFNLLGYGFDVYRKRIEPAHSLFELATYITFFPTLLSGPLVRYKNFDSQAKGTALDLPNVEDGIFCFCMGLAKKIILADTFATIANPLFDRYTELGLIGAWVAALAYSYQLYFDFSGYTDMAIGVGHLLGFKLPENFDAPYSASTITDFWQRWHITLSTWFRDYLFTPLSRMLLKRDGNQHPALIRTASQLLTMTLIGLWHGATVTFVIWGIYHGILLAVHAQIRKPRTERFYKYAGRLLTFLLVVIGWVIFRSPSIQAALRIYTSMIGLHGLGVSNLDQILPNWSKTALVIFLVVSLMLTNLSVDTWNLKWRRNWLFVAVLSFLFVLSLILLSQPSPFLYLQF